MEKLLLIVLSFAIVAWAVPKPMESLTNFFCFTFLTTFTIVNFKELHNEVFL